MGSDSKRGDWSFWNALLSVGRFEAERRNGKTSVRKKDSKARLLATRHDKTQLGRKAMKQLWYTRPIMISTVVVDSDITSNVQGKRAAT